MGACELLRGRFVIVALDRERDRCLVTRDQLGAQPLVHARVADGVLFAQHEHELLDLLPAYPESGPSRTAPMDRQRRDAPGRTLLRSDTAASGRSQADPRRHAHARRALVAPALCGGRCRAAQRRSANSLRNAAFAAVERAAAGSERPAVKLSGGLDSACVAAGLAASGFADGRRARRSEVRSPHTRSPTRAS